MKKIPTVLVRDPDDRSRVLPQITPGCEWVAAGEGVATRKWDGTCVLIRRDGLVVSAFARRIVRPGKTAPAGFVLADEDPITGNRIGWEPIEQSGYLRPFNEAAAARSGVLLPGTYELVGPKIQGNPEGLDDHQLIWHEMAERVGEFRFAGWNIGDVDGADNTRSSEMLLGSVRVAASQGYEGIVWHHPDGRRAKLKARDLGITPATLGGAA